MIKGTFEFAIGTPFLLQIFMKGVMSKLWLWINMMQLYNALTVLPVQIPLNVLIVQAYYNNIINMEVLPKEWVDAIIKWLGFREAPD